MFSKKKELSEELSKENKDKNILYALKGAFTLSMSSLVMLCNCYLKADFAIQNFKETSPTYAAVLNNSLSKFLLNVNGEYGTSFKSSGAWDAGDTLQWDMYNYYRSTYTQVGNGFGSNVVVKPGYENFVVTFGNNLSSLYSQINDISDTALSSVLNKTAVLQSFVPESMLLGLITGLGLTAFFMGPDIVEHFKEKKRLKLNKQEETQEPLAIEEKPTQETTEEIDVQTR